MGNRAVITTSPEEGKQIAEQLGVYLHWNGGRDSVEAFLKYCEIRGFRTPENDEYGWARLVQVIANFFGGSTSIGIGFCKNLDCDNYDNGVYLIKDWKIVGRIYAPKIEQNGYELVKMLKGIDEQQPEADRLGEEKIKELLEKTNG